MIRPRRIVDRTRGVEHGRITRFVGPSDPAGLIKPFVFLDHFGPSTSAQASGKPSLFAVDSLSLLLEGCEPGDPGRTDTAPGVRQVGGGTGSNHQLWFVLLPGAKGEEPVAADVSGESPQLMQSVRVITVRHGPARRERSAQVTLTCLDVALPAGGKWRYEPPARHTVAWIAVYEGSLAAPEAVTSGELVVFERSCHAIEFEALADTRFFLGSAVFHGTASTRGVAGTVPSEARVRSELAILASSSNASCSNR